MAFPAGCYHCVSVRCSAHQLRNHSSSRTAAFLDWLFPSISHWWSSPESETSLSSFCDCTNNLQHVLKYERLQQGSIPSCTGLWTKIMGGIGGQKVGYRSFNMQLGPGISPAADPLNFDGKFLRGGRETMTFSPPCGLAQGGGQEWVNKLFLNVVGKVILATVWQAS